MANLKRLKLLREEKGYKQTQLAELLGLTQPQIHQYEKGDHIPHDDMVKSIATFFDVSMEYLLGFSDNREPVLRSAEHTYSALENDLVSKMKMLSVEEQEMVDSFFDFHLVKKMQQPFQYDILEQMREQKGGEKKEDSEEDTEEEPEEDLKVE